MDAQRAANIIGIPYYVWDFSERFKLDVVDDFIAEYSAGRTPEPLHALQRADQVRRAAREGARPRLRRRLHRPLRRRSSPTPTATASCTAPAAWAKDQSLRARRAHRRAARARDVPARRDAVEGRGARRGRRARLQRRARSPTATTSASSPTATPAAGSPSASAPRPGDILDRDGQRDRHARGRARLHGRPAQGPEHRRARADDGKPRFVLEVRPKDNTVVVGPKEALDIAEIAGSRVHLGRARRRPTRRRRSTATCRSAPTPTRCPPSRGVSAVEGSDGARDHSRRARSTASPPARPPSSTSAPACSASARSTARSAPSPSA